jgi:hypothetical protein
MKNSVPASQINRNFSSKVILPYNRSKTLSKAESAATSFVDVPDSNSMPLQPLFLSSSGSSIFTGGGFAGAGAAAAIFLYCYALLRRRRALGAVGARSFCKATPLLCSFVAAQRGIAPLLQLSTDVVHEGLYKGAITSYHLAWMPMSGRCATSCDLKKTGSIVPDAVQALRNGPDRLGGDASRFVFQLRARGSAAICALQKPASVRRSGGIWRVACSLVTRTTAL